MSFRILQGLSLRYIQILTIPWIGVGSDMQTMLKCCNQTLFVRLGVGGYQVFFLHGPKFGAGFLLIIKQLAYRIMSKFFFCRLHLEIIFRDLSVRHSPHLRRFMYVKGVRAPEEF